uniref:PPM-type phosphatase domain-containing protein n=1 Tax=Thermomicrobium roseum TaxID=500 RepID=A0A7C5RT67_THERO
MAHVIERSARLARASASPYVALQYAADTTASGLRAFAVVVEPIDPLPSSPDVARRVIALLQHAFWQLGTHTSLEEASEALTEAYLRANHWLVTLNSGRPGSQWHRFGATCAILSAHDLILAQVPPSSAIVTQDGDLYTFPPRESEPTRFASALGSARQLQPALYYTRSAPGDLLLLTTSRYGSRLLDNHSHELPNATPGRIFEWLEELAVDEGDAEQVPAVILRVPEQPRFSAQPVRRLSELLRLLLPENTGQDERTGVTQDRKGVDATPLDEQTKGAREERADQNASLSDASIPLDEARPPASDRQAEETTVGERDEPEPYQVASRRGGQTLIELIAGLAIATVTGLLGIWQLVARRRRPLLPQDDGTFGLPRLERHEDRIRLPDLTPVRRQLPRLPASRLTGLIAIGLLGALTTTLVVSVQSGRNAERRQEFAQLYQSAVAERQLAEQATDSTIARAYLATASQRLERAAALGLEPELLAQERAAIERTLDRLLRVERLSASAVQVLGSVPAAPEGVHPRLFFGNGQLYLLTDALYRLDAGGTRLVRLLGPGDTVDGVTVGPLVGAAWADGAPVAFDGSVAYLFDPTAARWSAFPVGTFGAPYQNVAALGTFTGNLYLLQPQNGQILRFLNGAYANLPEDWTGGQAADQLRNAVDFEIDGRIHVLLADGTVLTFYRGALEATVTPQVEPPVTDAVALSQQPDRPYRYVGTRSGRILRLRTDGTLVQQFVSGSGVPSLDGLRDLAVDDVQGLAYVLTDRGLFLVRLPAPPAGS